MPANEISLDAFFGRYKTSTYTCFSHAAEVWEHITGQILEQRVWSYVAHGQLSLEDARRFHQLDAPVSPCLVLMEDSINNEPHLGVYFERKVMHLADHGVEYQPLAVATLGFRRVRYYR